MQHCAQELGAERKQRDCNRLIKAELLEKETKYRPHECKEAGKRIGEENS